MRGRFRVLVCSVAACGWSGAACGAPSGFSAARGCPFGCCPPAGPPSGLTSSGWALGWVVAAEQRPLAPSPKMSGAGRVPVGVEKRHVQGQDERGGAGDGDRCVVAKQLDRIELVFGRGSRGTVSVMVSSSPTRRGTTVALAVRARLRILMRGWTCLDFVSGGAKAIRMSRGLGVSRR